MSHSLALGQRALREAWRTPEALVPTLFIPLFFLVVNVGQAGKIFPSASTGFLNGQGYGAFQLPSSLLLAASFGTAALFLVEEIEGGYFDKLRATPIPRTSIVLGRLIAELAKGLLIATAIVLLALPFGITIASGLLGFVLLIALTALWAVVFAGFMQLIALKTRSAAATNSGGLIFFPLLFLTPNFVPRDMLTRPMEVAATLNPVTYVMEGLRSLILDDLAWEKIARGFAVVAVLGAIMLVLNVRMIRALIDAGPGPRGEALHGPVAAIRQAVERRPLIPALKGVFGEIAADSEWAIVRPPLVALPRPALTELLAELAAAGLDLGGFAPLRVPALAPA